MPCNALEVAEAIETLHGRGPADFREHCLHVSAHMLCIGNRAADLAEGRLLAEKAIADGSALGKFRVLVEAQGGDASYVDHPDKLPRARLIEPVPSPRSGWLTQIDARAIGEAAVALGAGRASKADAVDHSVGIVIHHKVVALNWSAAVHPACQRRKEACGGSSAPAAHIIGESQIPPLPLFYE
jgi:pyrimidine-nucleoside phosphorylase